MNIVISDTKQELGRKAAEEGAKFIREAIQKNGRANIIVATGASQFEMLENLVKAEGIDWAKVTAFHLDEYVGMPMAHPASFRKYLKERFVDQVPVKEFHYISGEGDCQAECRRLGDLIKKHPIDVAFVGIGENGHLAFNDPPADFNTPQEYIVVHLDPACRRQQFGEGWFKSLEGVPTQAISMSCRQIMDAKAIIVSVPDQRKAQAVKNTLQSPISPQVPASILREHPHVSLHLDRDSASMIELSKN